MKDFLVILRRNFIQPIVIAILLLASVLLLLGEKRDAWFISVVIIVNTVFGVVQELRARAALKKLELLSAPKARRVNGDGSVREVLYTEVAVGDVLRLLTGDEIPADCRLAEGRGLEVDESMLTGESVPVEKENGETVYAGSVVVAGLATVEVVAIGDDTKSGSMTASLKRYTPRRTPLQRSIARTISAMTYGALILAAAIFVVYYLSGEDAVRIFKTITSAAVVVVPEGLLLASTLLLAFGSLRLSRAKVLPQKLSAIEAMALVDVVCTDKTGTLTEDAMTFDELIPLADAPSNVSQLVGIVARETNSGNATSRAIVEALPSPKTYESIELLAFSSDRKYSGARFNYGGKTHTLLIGAPEILNTFAPVQKNMDEQMKQLSSQGVRVLYVVAFNDHITPLKKLKENTGTPLAVVSIVNVLRTGVESTVKYLQGRHVEIKVISGDNAATVSYIAAKAGIANADRSITGAELAKMSDKKWDETVQETTIFSRVLPEQKERIVGSLRKQGRFTAMVGDGVNDALALKKADLGVAMYAGATASRRVADIVLLNNSFNALPLGMRLGNRIMQAIEIIATLFFHKIIYGIVLLVSTLAMGIVYPFEPRHVTFMNIFLVTLPTIMWTLFPPSPTYRISPRHFWRDTLGAVWPIAAISGVMVTVVYAVLAKVHGGDPEGVATTTVLIATLFGIYLVFLMQKMFRTRNTRPARLARVLYMLIVIFFVAISFGFSYTREFFDFTSPVWRQAWPLVFALVASLALQWKFASMAGKRLADRYSVK